jgi:hypothetical protein
MRINIFRGDTLTMNFTITRLDVPVDLTGAAAWFTVKKLVTDPDPGVAQVTTGAGIEIHTPLAGKLTVEIPAVVTDLLLPGDYVWDLQVKESTGRISTANSGIIFVVADVTRTS